VVVANVVFVIAAVVITIVIALAVVGVQVAFAVFIGAERNFLSVGVSQLGVVRSLQINTKRALAGEVACFFIPFISYRQFDRVQREQISRLCLNVLTRLLNNS